MGRALTPHEREEFEKKRQKQLEENSRRLGLDVEERERIYRKALADVLAEGDEWEKELDAKNRAKAGIE